MIRTFRFLEFNPDIVISATLRMTGSWCYIMHNWEYCICSSIFTHIITNTTKSGVSMNPFALYEVGVSLAMFSEVIVQLIDKKNFHHYNDIIMSAMAFQITSLAIVYSTVYSTFFSIYRKHMISNYSEHCHIENCYICHKQNWASFHWLFSISCMKFFRMTMTLSIHVSISLLFILFYFIVIYVIS